MLYEMDSHRKKLVIALIGIFVIILAGAVLGLGGVTGAATGSGGFSEFFKFDIIIELVFILAIIIAVFYLELQVVKQP
jgi:hypothetical protein